MADAGVAARDLPARSGNLLLDFLALLGAAQPARIREQLSHLPGLLIAIDGMQPEKGSDCLYIVRELQCRVTLLAVNLTDSSQAALCEYLFAPLTGLAQELRLSWQGVVSDAQESIRLAVARACQVCHIRLVSRIACGLPANSPLKRTVP